MIEGIPLFHKCKNVKKINATQYSYSEMFKHLKEECPKYGKIYKCPNCKKSTKFTKKTLKNHLETDCDLVEFKCFKKCKQFVKKRYLKNHSC